MTARTTARSRRIFFLPVAAAVGAALVGGVAGIAANLVVGATATPQDTAAALDGPTLGLMTGAAFGLLTWLGALTWFANAVFPRGRRRGAVVLALVTALVTGAAIAAFVAAVSDGVPVLGFVLAALLVPAAAGAAFVHWDGGSTTRP